MYIHIYKNIYIDTYHTYVHKYIHTHIHTYIHTYIHMCVCACVYMCVSLRTQACRNMTHGGLLCRYNSTCSSTTCMCAATHLCLSIHGYTVTSFSNALFGLEDMARSTDDGLGKSTSLYESVCTFMASSRDNCLASFFSLFGEHAIYVSCYICIMHFFPFSESMLYMYHAYIPRDEDILSMYVMHACRVCISYDGVVTFSE